MFFSLRENYFPPLALCIPSKMGRCVAITSSGQK